MLLIPNMCVLAVDLPLLPESQPTEIIESEGAQVVIVDTEDPSSLLEALDSEVSLMVSL